MTSAELQALIDNIDTTGSEGTSGQDLKDIFEAIKVDLYASKFKKIWLAEFNQGGVLVGLTPAITERVNLGFTYVGVTRNSSGGGSVISFGFDFTGTNFNVQKTVCLAGTGKLIDTTGTPSYPRVFTLDFISNNYFQLSGIPSNDLGGNPKDINNASPFKILLVEFE